MKEILCFGDSNTYGLIPGTKNRYGRDTRWTGLIEQQLYGKGCRIIEEGLCGRTTVFEDELREGRKGAAFLPTLLESHAPVDRVVLMQKQFYINIFSIKNFFYFIKITAHYCCFLKIWKLSYF